MTNLCAICEGTTTFLSRRKIANDEVVCESCFKKAKTLTNKQILKLKNVSASEIKESIKNSGTSFEDLIGMPVSALQTNSCPSCYSIDIQFMQNNKKAFSVGKAVGGAVLTGGVGTLAGFVGKKGDDQWRCNDCGNIFTTKKQ